ncbi:MAG TPA: hypothetical protein VN843_01170, partial [Anaerolineales bacterium]|nr:hypothetical protein [Anaerolineales bacterium]
NSERMLQTVEGMLFVRGDVEHILQSLGVSPSQIVTEASVSASDASEAAIMFESNEPEPEMDLDALFASASDKKKVDDLDAFWNDAVEKTGNIPTNPDVITYEEASKLGLTPGKGTGRLPPTGPLKKK